MTKEEALEFKQRWQFVNDFIAEEIRTTKPEVRFRQLRTMIATSHHLGGQDSETEVAEVRERRLQLKNQLNASS